MQRTLLIGLIIILWYVPANALVLNKALQNQPEKLMAELCHKYADRWTNYFISQENPTRFKCAAYEYVSVFNGDTGVETQHMGWREYLDRALDLKWPKDDISIKFLDLEAVFEYSEYDHYEYRCQLQAHLWNKKQPSNSSLEMSCYPYSRLETVDQNSGMVTSMTTWETFITTQGVEIERPFFHPENVSISIRCMRFAVVWNRFLRKDTKNTRKVRCYPLSHIETIQLNNGKRLEHISWDDYITFVDKLKYPPRKKLVERLLWTHTAKIFTFKE